MAGRPTALTDEVRAAILDALERGSYRQVAAAAAGVHRNSLRNWEKRGEEGEEPYASFVAAMQEAEAKGEQLLLAGIWEASGKESCWQARAWILERRFPARWAGRVRQQVAEELGSLTDRLRRGLDADTYQRVVEVASSEDAPAAAGKPSH